MEQVRDLISAAGSLGWNLTQGWDLGGPFRCDIRWPLLQAPWEGPSTGFMELGGPDPAGGGSLHSAFLNSPIEQIIARADWKPGVRHLSLSSAHAFGARWTGTFNRRDMDNQWQFALSADRLAVSDLDLWLNPRWRESFIDRMLPFLSPRVAATAVPENMRATGRLSVDQFTLAPLTLHRLQGALALNGRHLELTDAQAQFYGGTVSGMFIADLKQVPSYQINADFARVDLSALAGASANFDGLFAGSASGQVFFLAHGTSRSDLFSSLQCRGSAGVDGPELQNINLLASLRDVTPRPGASAFRDASAAFTCAARKIQFHDFALIAPEEEIDGAGSVDFSNNLDFRLQVLRNSASAATSIADETPSSAPASFQLSGPLSSPQIAHIASSPPHRAR